MVICSRCGGSIEDGVPVASGKRKRVLRIVEVFSGGVDDRFTGVFIVFFYFSYL